MSEGRGSAQGLPSESHPCPYPVQSPHHTFVPQLPTQRVLSSQVPPLTTRGHVNGKSKWI